MIEESVYLAGSDGPRRAVQIVIYGHARDKPKLRWSFRHTPPVAHGPKPDRRTSRNCRCDFPHLPPLRAKRYGRQLRAYDQPSSAASPAPFCRFPTRPGLSISRKQLVGLGIDLVSTGGTAKALKDAGLKVRRRRRSHRFPEMMDGRVKTLHPKVHGGLLAIRDNNEHAAAMQAHKIEPIDLLVVNLYPFEATVAKGADYDDCIENIDIGGPAMIRAAAKNHADVAVVVDADRLRRRARRD